MDRGEFLVKPSFGGDRQAVNITFTILCLWFRASKSVLLNNQQMQLFAVNFIPLPGSLYMFRAFYTPIIRSAILTVSTASGKNHCIISATFFQRGLVLVSIGPRWKNVAETIL